MDTTTTKLTNLPILEFKQNIVTYVNQTDLPTEIKRMVLKEIYDAIVEVNNQEIQKEWGARQAQLQSEQDNQDNKTEKDS